MRRLLPVLLLLPLVLGYEDSFDAHVHDLEERHAAAEKLLDEENVRGAIKAYGEIILIEPDDDTAYAELGRCYLILGDTDRAREAFANTLHIDPDNRLARLGMIHIADPDAPLYDSLTDEAPYLSPRETPSEEVES